MVSMRIAGPVSAPEPCVDLPQSGSARGWALTPSSCTLSRVLDARSGEHGRPSAVATRFAKQQFRNLHYTRSNARASPMFRVAAATSEQNDAVAMASTEEEVFSPLTPTPEDIKSLLTQVCEETKIAELDLKVGAFKLHMKRSLEKPKASPAPVLASTAAPAMSVAPAAGSAATVPALASASAAPKPTGPRVSPLMTKAAFFDELYRLAEESGLVFITSPKVGLFRQSRVVKGKPTPPLCREGQSVKEGQVVCYLEQLGTSSAVESEVAGEVIKILYEDGAPVGYGDPLVAVKPKKP